MNVCLNGIWHKRLSYILMLINSEEIKALKALEAWASQGTLNQENLSRDSNVEFNLHCNK